jgi:hypothetical protein
MSLSLRACISRAASRAIWPLLAAGALALAGCDPNTSAGLNAAQPRGATVAFDAIDGLPPAQFTKLVEDLNTEAQTRRLAIISRQGQSAYRVRGYLAAKVSKHETTVSWVWDVFDREENRALRITGEESVKGRHPNPWSVADDAMMQRIARNSMDQLAAFLVSPDVAPGTPVAAAPAGQVALLGQRDSSPEAAGIFRIAKPRADPLPDSGNADAVEVPPARKTVADAAPNR